MFIIEILTKEGWEHCMEFAFDPYPTYDSAAIDLAKISALYPDFEFRVIPFVLED